MARRRRVDHEVSDRFYDRRVEPWATDEDYTAVAAAGTDVYALGALTGGHLDFVRFASIPIEERQAWALSCLASGRRNHAIVAWAEVNNVPSYRALDFFLGEPRTV